MSYSPTIGRWLETEPSGADPYVDGLNLYEAFANNPLNRLDPTGRYSTTYTGPFLYQDSKEVGVYFVVGSTPGPLDNWIPGVKYIGSSSRLACPGIKKFPIGDGWVNKDKWNTQQFKRIEVGMLDTYIDEIRYTVRLMASNGLLHDNADVTMNGFLLACGVFMGGGAMGIGSKVLNPENLRLGSGPYPAALKNGTVTIGTMHGSAADSAGGSIDGSGWVNVDAAGTVIEWTQFTATSGFTPF